MSGAQTDAAAAEPARPLLRVVRGNPSPEELAALLAVVTARSSAAPAAVPSPPSAWRSRAALVRRPVHAGPGAWRASGLPGLH
ncbi:MAG TPA: acyl-CoA carboxylase subunit epsilon [Mycobacteriales bacterium]|nr:acyl-CoA carboxylase subunit epsilon [Mycobacteriales bacterium]